MKVIKNISIQETLGNLIVKYGQQNIKHHYSSDYDGNDIISIFVNDIETCWWFNKNLNLNENGTAIYFTAIFD